MNKHTIKIKEIELKIHQNPQLNQQNLVILSFIDLLYYFILRKFPHKTESYICHKAYLSPDLFSKIINSKYHPSIKTIIALGLALELNMHEFELFLASANYTFSLNNTFDIAIIYCIENKIYDLLEVNKILNDLNL